MKMLLFGAGASIPFYPSLNTDYVTRQIKEHKCWINVIELYNKYANITFNSNEITDLIDTICNKEPKANFEDICGFIDAIANTLLHPEIYGKVNKFGNIIHILQTCNILNIAQKFQRNIEHLPYIYRCLIVDAIIKAPSIPNYQEIIALQADFINCFLGNDETSSIISLNYDDVLNDSIGFKYYNGFNNNIHKISPFSVEEYFNSNHTISYLHGSIRFYCPFLDIHYSRENVPTIAERIQGLFSQHIRPLITENFSYNTFITTGIEKNTSLDYLPYNYYYTKFARDICQTNTIISIGYSFRDQHVNRILSPYLKINKQNIIIVVDFYEKDIDCDDEDIFDNIIVEIFKTFSIEDFPSENNDNIRRINSLGYGYLSPQIVFYKKGYGVFLEEYKQVIEYCRTNKYIKE